LDDLIRLENFGAPKIRGIHEKRYNKDKIRANTRNWTAKVLMSPIIAQDRKERAVLESREIDDGLGSGDFPGELRNIPFNITQKGSLKKIPP